MYCDIYLDVFFAVNLLLDFLLLCLTNQVIKGTANPFQSLLGGVAGAAAMCLILIFTAYIPMGRIAIIHGIIAVFMVKIGCKCKNLQELLKAVVIFFLCTFLAGGILSVLPGNCRKNIIVFSTITITAYWMLYIGIRLYKYLKGKEPLLCQVTVALRGKEVNAIGLYDTGNRLFDRETGKSVSVIEYTCLRRILTKEQRTALEQFCSMETERENPKEVLEAFHPRFILYNSVGCKSGLLPIITVDSITVNFRGKKTVEKKTLIGISMETLSLVGNYEMIISPAILKH